MKDFLLTRSALFGAIVLFIATVLPMRAFDSFLKNDQAPQGIVSLELAITLKKSIDILRSWETPKEERAAGLSLGFDYLFMVGYSGILTVLLLRIEKRIITQDNWRKYFSYVIVGIWIAALFDAIENYAMIQLFMGSTRQVWASLAFYFASSKFLILAISVLTIIGSLPFVIKKRNT